MNIKYRGDKDRKTISDPRSSDAWSDEPAEVISVSFGVGSEEVLASNVSDDDIEKAMEFSEAFDEYLTAKAAAAGLIKKWIDVASSGRQARDALITDKGTNHVSTKEEPPPGGTGSTRPSVVKFPAKEQGIEAITTLISVLTKKTEDLDAQHAEQLREQKASNAELDDKLKRSEQLMRELESTKKTIEQERDEANLRHKGVTLELEQAELARRNLETQLNTANTNIRAAQAAHREANGRTWIMMIISVIVVAAVIIAGAVFKVF